MNVLKDLLRVKLLFLSLFCFHSLSAQIIDGVEYGLDSYSKTARVAAIDQSAVEIVIPETVSYEDQVYSVTEIDDWCFKDNVNLESVTIGVPMNRIPNYFFSGCVNLKTVVLPINVESIGEESFACCEKLPSLDFLPPSVTAIGDEAFLDCISLDEIVIKKGVQYGYGVFSGCSGVTSMTIEAIPGGSDANFNYSGCDNLKKLHIEDSDEPLEISLPVYSPIEEAYIGRDLKQEYLYGAVPMFTQFPKDSLRKVTFGDKVTYVPSDIFCDATQLKTIIFGNNIKRIGERAFCRTALTEIAIPGNIDSLYNEAFSGNSELVSVTLPASLEYIGESCFSGSSIAEIKLPNKISAIERGTFEGCKSLKSIVIPESVTSIGPHAFFDCKALAQLTFGKNVREIGDGAFYECYKLYDVYYDGTISDWCKMEILNGTYEEDTNPLLAAKNFYVDDGISYKKVTDLVIPADVQEIKKSSFHGCRVLTSVTIPSNVRKIGETAFSDCVNVKYISIDADTVGSMAFLGCKADSLVLGTNVKVIKDYAFYTPLARPKHVIYTGSIDQWLNLEVENNALQCGNLRINDVLLTNLELEQFSTLAIRPNAFYGCTSLKTVNLPYSVKTVGTQAFANCPNLTDVVAKGLTNIDVLAFYNCGKLKKANLVLGTSTRSGNSEYLNIGGSAFSLCSSLEELLLPDNLGHIGAGAFTATPWYENNFSDGLVYFGKTLYDYKGEMPENYVVNIKEGTTAINESALLYQKNMIDVIIPNSVTSIGENAFSYSSLKSIRLPENIDTLYAILKGCYELKSINIPSGVDFVKADAFVNCNSLENICIEDSEQPLKFEAYEWYLYNGEYIPTFIDCFGFSDSYPKHLYIGRNLQSDTLSYAGNDWYYNVSRAFVTDSLQTLTLGQYVTEIDMRYIPAYTEWVDDNEYNYTLLTDVKCMGMIPPSMNDDPFVAVKNIVPLSVPEGAVEFYRTADVWSGFYTIKGIDFTDVKDLPADTMHNLPIYDIRGLRVNSDMDKLPAGVYIQGGKKLLKKNL